MINVKTTIPDSTPKIFTFKEMLATIGIFETHFFNDIIYVSFGNGVDFFAYNSTAVSPRLTPLSMTNTGGWQDKKFVLSKQNIQLSNG